LSVQNAITEASLPHLLKMLRSGDYKKKKEALLLLRKMGIDTPYRICPVCDNVGKPVIKISNGKQTHFIYHYRRGKAKYYCSVENVARQVDRKQRRLTCPKCGREGLFTRRKGVQCAYKDHIKARVYGVTRLVIRHGSEACFINKTHLKELRNRYAFIKDTKITTSHPVILYSKEGILYRGVRDKGRYDRSDLKNKLGLSLTGVKRIQHIIRTLEGQLRAKNRGKDIRFDVEKRLKEYRSILEQKQKEKEEEAKIKAKEEEEYELPLLRDEWFVQHQEKLRSNELSNR